MMVNIKKSKVNPSKVEEMYRSGMTYQQIGDLYGVSRQYVARIGKERGLGRSDGGQKKKKQNRIEKLRIKKDRQTMKKYGCTYKELMRSIKTIPKDPIKAFNVQKENAINRGIEWNFPFPDWWKMWRESGKWELRGRGAKKYCMARFNDQGPYEIGNVEIITNSENIRDARAIEAKAKLEVKP